MKIVKKSNGIRVLLAIVCLSTCILSAKGKLSQ